MSTHRITSRRRRRSPPCSSRANALLRGPLTERDRRQPRQLPLGRHVQNRFTAWLTPGVCGNRVGGRRRHRSEPQPAVDHAERVRMKGASPAVVVVREELGAIRRDVDVGRALGLARLARQAQVERLLDVLVLPAVRARPRPAAARTACARGRACCAAPRASPCSSGTSIPCRACGTRPGRRSAATLVRSEPPSSGNAKCVIGRRGA